METQPSAPRYEMSRNDVRYLQCYGLRRLVLYSTASLTREGTHGGQVPVELVFKCCGAELEGRKQQTPPLAMLEQAMCTCTKAQWLRQRSERLQLTKAGWQAFGWDNAGRALAPVAATANPAAEQASATVMEILVEIHKEAGKKSSRYEFDPRVNRVGEITDRELQTWVTWMGVPKNSGKEAIGGALQHGWAVATPTGSLSDLRLIGTTDLGLRENRRRTVRHSDRPARTSPQEGAAIVYAPAELKDAIVGYLRSAEVELGERVYRLPDGETRAEVQRWNEELDWPLFGLLLDELEEYVKRLFPGITMGSLTPVWNGERLAAKGVVRHVKAALPDTTEYDIYRAFLESPHPASGQFASAILALLDEGRICFSDIRIERNGDPGVGGAVVRVNESKEPAEPGIKRDGSFTGKDAGRKEQWERASEAVKIANRLSGVERSWRSFWGSFCKKHQVRTRRGTKKDGTPTEYRPEVEIASLVHACIVNVDEFEKATPESVRRKQAIMEKLKREYGIDPVLREELLSRD